MSYLCPATPAPALAILLTRHRPTVIDGQCWIWPRTRTPNGYGKLGSGSRARMAHRVFFEAQFGSPPADCVLHHVCEHRACVNPWHLRPVTPRENTLLGSGPTAVNARKTHCPQGHPYDEANTIRLGNGARRCRACKRADDARRYATRGRPAPSREVQPVLRASPGEYENRPGGTTPAPGARIGRTRRLLQPLRWIWTRLCTLWAQLWRLAPALPGLSSLTSSSSGAARPAERSGAQQPAPCSRTPSRRR